MPLSYLKSSLDRFIAVRDGGFGSTTKYLKSSLDRFIDKKILVADKLSRNLKSSLDRFIVSSGIREIIHQSKFKIQFG